MVNLLDNTATPLDNTPVEKKTMQPQKYLFDAEFDYSESSDDIQSITPRQLSKAKTEVKQTAYDDGYQKGVQETNDSINRIAGDQLFVITGKIDELIQSENEILETFHKQVAQVSELVTSKVLPTLAEQGAASEVKGILEKASSQLPTDKKVSIYVQEPLVDLIKEHMKTLLNSEESQANLTVNAGENFQPTDCKILWEGAGIEHYMDNVLLEVEKILLRLGGESLPLSEESSEESGGDLPTQNPTETPETTNNPIPESCAPDEATPPQEDTQSKENHEMEA